MHCYFAVSKVCNLRCQYCYVPEYNKSHQANYDSQAVAAARRFSEKIRQEQFPFESITLHGAEPTILSAKALGKVTRIFWEATGKQVQIQSNGTRFEESYLKKLLDVIENPDRLFVGISIDGSASIHDPQRNDTWDRVTGNIKTLRKHGFGLSEGEKKIFADWLYESRNLKHLQAFMPNLCMHDGNGCEFYEFDIDGNCYSCNKSYYDLGIFANWFEEPFESIRTKRSIIYRLRPVDPECETCPYDSLCHGGCPLSREGNKSVDCRIKKTIYPKLLRDGIRAEPFCRLPNLRTHSRNSRGGGCRLPSITRWQAGHGSSNVC